MKQAPRHKRKPNFASRLQTAPTEVIKNHEAPAANEVFFDDQATAADEIVMMGLLKAAAHDDVELLEEVMSIFPSMNLTLHSVSFRDTDDNCVYSLLGIAKKLFAFKVGCFLISQGLTQDYIDNEGIFD